MRDKTPHPYPAGFPWHRTPPPAWAWATAVCRLQHGSGSGLPRPCLRSCLPYTVMFHGRHGWGLPRASAPLFLHATAGGLRRTSPASPCRRGRMACGSVTTLGIRTSLVEAVPALQGARSPLRPPGYAVDAAPILFPVRSLTTPPWTQDSLRVGGSPLPDRDWHPARDAKLILAR